MSDEVSSAVLSTSQKAIEVALELIKMLAPLAKSLLGEVYHKSVDGLNFVGGKIVSARANGTVSSKGLLVEAQKANSTISTTSNFLARDADLVAEKAKEYKIPIAIIGNGEKRTIEFLDRDKGAVEQITNEVMQERINGAPQSVKCFTVGENNVSTLKTAFEENGIECQFVGGKDGKISCIYPAECAEQVAVIKADYKRNYDEIAENCSIIANVPETERQTEISARIDALTNAKIGSEQRSNVYDNIISDMRNGNVEIPQYSENNLRIVEREMPFAKQVAGKAFWEKQGYTLNENAKGVEIIAPQVDESGNPVLDENGKQTFTTTTVYDISETNAFEKTVDKEIGVLKSEYNAEKANAFEAAEDKKVVISDEANGKNVEITVDGKTRKSDVSELLREKLGYSAVQADLAANKMCYELGLDKEKFFENPAQIENINALKTNIRYPSDDISIRDVRYDAVNFKDGGTTHILLQNGENAVGLTPEKMTDSEMKNLCVNKLGLS